MQTDGELVRAMKSAKYTKATAKLGVVSGAIITVIGLVAGSGATVIGVILLVVGVVLRISANVALNNSIWRLAFHAVGKPVPPSSQVPVEVQRELTMMFQESVLEYSSIGFTVPLDDLFARRVREQAGF